MRTAVSTMTQKILQHLYRTFCCHLLEQVILWKLGVTQLTTISNRGSKRLAVSCKIRWARADRHHACNLAVHPLTNWALRCCVFSWPTPTESDSFHLFCISLRVRYIQDAPPPDVYMLLRSAVQRVRRRWRWHHTDLNISLQIEFDVNTFW